MICLKSFGVRCIGWGSHKTKFVWPSAMIRVFHFNPPRKSTHSCHLLVGAKDGINSCSRPPLFYWSLTLFSFYSTVSAPDIYSVHGQVRCKAKKHPCATLLRRASSTFCPWVDHLLQMNASSCTVVRKENSSFIELLTTWSVWLDLWNNTLLYVF